MNDKYKQLKATTMRTEKNQLQEKVATYGLQSLSDSELFTLLGYKGEPKNFHASTQFKAMKEAVRRQEIEPQYKITTSKHAFDRLSFLEGLDHEQFWCIYLRRNNTVIKESFISKGDISGTVVNIKAILSDAILLKASAIVLSHNHPSGEMRPSAQDVKITTQIKQAATLIDVNLIDHIIVGNKEYYSFADNSIL